VDERTPEQKRQDQLGLRQAVDRLMEHMHQKGRLRERKGRLLTQLLSEHTSTPSPGASATSGTPGASSGAPRPMKMGTTGSPFPFDATAG